MNYHLCGLGLSNYSSIFNKYRQYGAGDEENKIVTTYVQGSEPNRWYLIDDKNLNSLIRKTPGGRYPTNWFTPGPVLSDDGRYIFMVEYHEDSDSYRGQGYRPRWSIYRYELNSPGGDTDPSDLSKIANRHRILLWNNPSKPLPTHNGPIAKGDIFFEDEFNL